MCWFCILLQSVFAELRDIGDLIHFVLDYGGCLLVPAKYKFFVQMLDFVSCKTCMRAMFEHCIKQF